MNLPGLPVRSLYRVSTKASEEMNSPDHSFHGSSTFFVLQLFHGLSLFHTEFDDGQSLFQHFNVGANVVGSKPRRAQERPFGHVVVKVRIGNAGSGGGAESNLIDPRLPAEPPAFPSLAGIVVGDDGRLLLEECVRARVVEVVMRINDKANRLVGDGL